MEITDKHVLCCDWGTSSFRLRLVDHKSLDILAELNLPAGVNKTFNEWKEQNNKGQISRQAFYLDQLKGYIRMLSENEGVTVENLPVIISGMASSSIGMEEIAYASLPFAVDGSDASVRFIDKTDDFPHPVLLISGVASHSDVMRGEEVQLVGLINLRCFSASAASQGIFVFPGTHSKHITVRNDIIGGFRTYMTGEVFQLLCKYSILQQSVVPESQKDVMTSSNRFAFGLGVKTGASEALLHAVFKVRTNRLFDKMSADENYFFLSGLLIGSELSGLNNENEIPVVIAAGANLSKQYAIAVEELGISNAIVVQPDLVEKATIAGQIKVLTGYRLSKT